MTLDFSGAPGALFAILGKIGAVLKNAKSLQATQLTALTSTSTGLVRQLNNESDVQALVGSSYIGILNGIGAAGGTMQGVATQAAVRLVFRDNPQLSQTLESGDTLTSLLEIIRQMKQQGATVRAMSITATPTTVSGQPGPHFTGTGSGVVVASVRRPSDGLVLENSFAETLTLKCSGDSYLGTGTAGNEPFSLTGTGNQSNVFAFNWPLGSNCVANLSAIDGGVNNGSGNLLTNSGFDTFTVADTPDNWSYVAGVASTDFFQESTLSYDGFGALRLLGGGGVKHQWRQKFNDSTGTTGTLTPLTQLGLCVFLRRDGTAGTGTLSVELVDDSGNVVNDQGGTPNSFTINLSTLTTTYAPFTGAFRLPAIMPSTVYLQFRETVAYAGGGSYYTDLASLGSMTQCYTSGPYVSVHAGSIPFLTGDYAFATVTNGRGSGGTLSTFQTLFGQLFSEMISSELLLPSAASPSIPDALIN